LKNACRVLAGKLKWNGQFRRTVHRWSNNIKICVDKIGCEDVDWICLVQVGSSYELLLNGIETQGSIKGRIFVEYVGSCHLAQVWSSDESLVK
jgi:hypothetical protein